MTCPLIHGRVVGVCRASGHTFHKKARDEIRLLAGRGVEGDAHCGRQVQHRSRTTQDPAQPNLRQVHLMAEELHQLLREEGYRVDPGRLGENVTTRGLFLPSLPEGSLLWLGSLACLRVTGLRNPCSQLDRDQPGLQQAVLGRGEDGELLRWAGIMAVILEGGPVRVGDAIRVEAPREPHRRLAVV